MNTEQKLAILGAAAKFDVCASSCAKSPRPTGKNYIGNLSSSGICHSYTPDGRCVSLLKVLMTNTCQNDCHYCVNRVSNDFQRASFEAEELAKLFLELYRRNYVEGLFLSSGVQENTTKTMQKMLTILEILRYRYRYRGYIHLKILPRSTADVVERGAQLADRLSINMEAPNPKRLENIARQKSFHLDLLDTMTLIQKQVEKGRLKSGHTTQFVVGAAQETDAELLRTTNWLYKHKSLKRAYFSAFIPVNQTLPPGQKPTPLLREHRLYQADWLMRFYEFSLSEIVLDEQANLHLDFDPKLAYAFYKPEKFPLEINRASYQDLLKIPGVGITSARRIVRVRREYPLCNLGELKNLGVVTKRAAPFIMIKGKKQATYSKLKITRQLPLFTLSENDKVDSCIKLLSA